MKEVVRKALPDTWKEKIREIRSVFGEKIHNKNLYAEAVRNLDGVEIGGPSNLFQYKLPIYSACSSLEFVNFSSQTVWEGKLLKETKYFKGMTGKQHVSEASDLSLFSDNQFDFVLSSNCLEHVANPIKALKEWKRIAGKFIILVLPRKDFNFDHRRPITSFEHLLADYEMDVDEHDLTHLDEILELHDLDLDPPAGSLEQFKARSLKNFENRCLHHHVFDDQLVRAMCDFLNLTIVENTMTKSDWIFLIQVSE